MLDRAGGYGEQHAGHPWPSAFLHWLAFARPLPCAINRHGKLKSTWQSQGVLQSNFVMDRTREFSKSPTSHWYAQHTFLSKRVCSSAICRSKRQVKKVRDMQLWWRRCCASATRFLLALAAVLNRSQQWISTAAECLAPVMAWTLAICPVYRMHTSCLQSIYDTSQGRISIWMEELLFALVWPDTELIMRRPAFSPQCRTSLCSCKNC